MAQSVLSNLAGRTDTRTVLAPRNDSAAGSIAVTGQYLFDRFIGNDDAEVTKMGIVRQLVNQVDTQTFKKALKDMVEIATSKGEAVEKTARNHQTVMRIAFGALKFAQDKLAEQGYTDRTGYQVMRVIGKKALEAKGVKWDGSKVLNTEQKQMQSATKEAQKALAEVQRDNPQQIGESFGDWMARIQGAVENRLDADRKEKHYEALTKMADKIVEMAGDDLNTIVYILAKSGKVDMEQVQEALDQAAEDEAAQAETEAQQQQDAALQAEASEQVQA